MSYVKPGDLITTMIDAGASKVFMSARNTVVRAAMAFALLSLAAAFAVTVSVASNQEDKASHRGEPDSIS